MLWSSRERLLEMLMVNFTHEVCSNVTSHSSFVHFVLVFYGKQVILQLQHCQSHTILLVNGKVGTQSCWEKVNIPIHMPSLKALMTFPVHTNDMG